MFFFFIKQNTAYEMRISDWSSDVCSSDLKRMSEDLTEYMTEVGLKVRYLHSGIDTLERIEIIRDLRLGVFDILIGINLLREGLDIPECGLVAILDADKEIGSASCRERVCQHV